MNYYLKLDINPNRVNFGSLWFKNCKPQQGIREDLKNSENWPLRGLFSVSRDLYWNKDEEFPMEPEARVLYNIRNHVAHKYLTVHDSISSTIGNIGEQKSLCDLSLNLSSFELEVASLKLLNLVRSAMIYLSLAANIHEQKNINDEDLYVSTHLYPMGDQR